MKQPSKLSIWTLPSRPSSSTATNLRHRRKTCRRRGSCVRYSRRERPILRQSWWEAMWRRYRNVTCLKKKLISRATVKDPIRSSNCYRMWKPRTIIAEIDKLVTEYGIRNIKIADELFVLNPKHVTDLCDLL